MNSQPISTPGSNPEKTEASTDANTPATVVTPPTTALPTTPATAPKAGIHTTQFWLLAGVLLLVAWMVFAGKLEAGWFAALAPVVAIVYQCVRQNLYLEASTHPNDALNQILETVLAQLPAPTGADATAVISALRHTSPPPLPQQSSEAAPGTQNSPADAGSKLAPAASLCVLGAILLGLSGCAETPYYVSGISGTVDTSKDGTRISGGALGVTISPNPYYSSQALPSTEGLAK